MIFFGDLLQLEPVGGQPVFSAVPDSVVKYRIGSAAAPNIWEETVVYESDTALFSACGGAARVFVDGVYRWLVPHEDGAKAAVKSAMSACAAAAESETDATAKQQKLDNCRSSSAREALSKALGKSDSNEVSKTEVEAFVRNAAKTAVADAMKAAMEDESTSEVEKRQAVKQALAQSLGQSEIDDTSLEFFKKKWCVYQ